MATSNHNNTSSQPTTKVICSNCGAEIIIPNHEHHVSGIAIGKDSKLGTVVLPTDSSTSKPNIHEAVSVITESLGASPQAKNVSPIEVLADLIAKIEDEGYIDVSNIVRRWIPSQCISMLQSRYGFHSELKARGLDYSWDVLTNDLERQMKLFTAKDTEGYRDRHRWYNRKVALEMAEDFYRKLQKEISDMPRHKHKGREYVKLVCKLFNGGRGIHIDELATFYNEFETFIDGIRKATHPKALFNAVNKFNEFRSTINAHFEPSPAFMNAYKAAGAYYTMKDFILFEGFKMKVDGVGSTDYHYESPNSPNKRRFVEQEESLAALERKASVIVSRGVCDFGYELLGLLKDFLSYNSFNYAETKDKWVRQSEARRLMRVLKGNRRPRK